MLLRVQPNWLEKRHFICCEPTLRGFWLFPAGCRRGQTVFGVLLRSRPRELRLTIFEYAGYVDIGGGKEIFYWFVESQRDPASDPLVCVCMSLLSQLDPEPLVSS